MSKICGCLSQEILTHPHTWEIPKRPGGEWNQTISPHTSRFDVCLKAAPHQSPSTPMTTLMSLKQGIRFSYVFTKHGQKGPRNATRSREAEKPRSRGAAGQAEKPRSREAEKPPGKPRSREATGQAEKPRSHRTS